MGADEAGLPSPPALACDSMSYRLSALIFSEKGDFYEKSIRPLTARPI
jgi:hypothetical protein